MKLPAQQGGAGPKGGAAAAPPVVRDFHDALGRHPDMAVAVAAIKVAMSSSPRLWYNRPDSV